MLYAMLELFRHSFGGVNYEIRREQARRVSFNLKKFFRSCLLVLSTGLSKLKSGFPQDFTVLFVSRGLS